MQKTLRSLIHEKISPELRFQLEILSKKRNLINEEKHDKILELFREFNIEGIVPLGPGTNRYAIKVDGYVLKIATDNDGKIDNLKEFKMAKRLYPRVTKTYEVSENGTLLIAEYISPFSSYHEMLMYADQIRDILTELSSTYLIGDVGITSKNYANWGLRPGSNEPVCLDFAYVYEVSSELFVCRKCQTNAMLIPNRDFTELNCSNPSCGAKYSFEDIRSKIGNDLHRHEIGDLKEEGYYLTESNVTTELSEQRSNYLVKKKASNKKEKLEIDIEEDISMNKNLENNMAIANAITSTSPFALHIIKAVAVKDDDDDMNDENVIHATAELVNDEEEDIDTSDLAFSCSIDDELDEETTVVSDDSDEFEVTTTDVIQVPVADTIIDDTAIEDPEEKNNVVEAIAIVDDKPEVIKNNKHKSNKKKECVDNPTGLIDDWFIKNASKAVSKLSYRISKCLEMAHQYDDVKDEIQDIHNPDDYYQNIQTTVYRSIVSFCNFDEKIEPKENGERFRKLFLPPTEIIGKPYEATMIFLSRVWNNKNIYTIENPDIMDTYCNIYSDYRGIQREWIEVFKERLAYKMEIDETGIEKVASAIANVWCVPEEKSIVAELEVVEEVEVVMPIMECGVVDHNDRVYNATAIDNMSDDIKTIYPAIDDSNSKAEEPTSTKDSTIIDDENEDVVFSGSIDVNVIQNPAIDDDCEDEYEDIDEENEEDDDDIYDEEDEFEESSIVDTLGVEIITDNDDDWDIIRVSDGSAYGMICMQFQIKSFNTIDGNKNIPSVVDDRNGIWDWLIHFIPDIKFTTNDLDKWLDLNEPDSNIHFLILDEADNGIYTIGIYMTNEMLVVKNGNVVPYDDTRTLKKINNFIRKEIAHSSLSQLRRTLSDTSNIMDELEVIEYLERFFSSDGDYEDNDAEEVTENNDAIDAAVAAMMDDEITDTTTNTEVPETDIATPVEVVASEPFRGGDDGCVLDGSGSEIISNEEEGTKYTEETEAEGKENDAQSVINEDCKTFKPIRRF